VSCRKRSADVVVELPKGGRSVVLGGGKDFRFYWGEGVAFNFVFTSLVLGGVICVRWKGDGLLWCLRCILRGLRTSWCAYIRIIIEVNSIANLTEVSRDQDVLAQLSRVGAA
jgi:hypothetical protein